MEEALGGHPGQPPFYQPFEWNQLPTFLHPPTPPHCEQLEVGNLVLVIFILSVLGTGLN